MSIRILITGGTIDRNYDHLNSQLIFTETQVPLMLEQARSKVPVQMEVVMLEDSAFMTDKDRETILERCIAAPNDRILITHGTDTMAETAQVIGKSALKKTIVMTGAMLPFAFGKSDALYNLGCAMTAVQTLPHGVYIAMNGLVFSWDNVRKNRDKGEFEFLSYH